MAKLTRAQARVIEGVISDLKAARAYLMRPHVAICHAGKLNAAIPHHGGSDPSHEYRQATPFERTAHTGRDDSKWSIDWVRTLQPVAKDSGSELVRLSTAIHDAERFIEANA